MIVDGVRVVELTAWVAGPAAAGVMADWGADVVKVEPASGDPQRAIFGAIGVRDQGSVPPFELDNRGKRSVVLDLRSEGGQEAMERLLAGADVFVTNMRVAALTRLGLDPDGVTVAWIDVEGAHEVRMLFATRARTRRELAAQLAQALCVHRHDRA